MKMIGQFILTVLALSLFAAIGMAAYSMQGMDILQDERQIIAATTNCTSEGMKVSFYKEGGKPNAPCDSRELSRIMFLSGMEEQARYKECSMPDALRDFASVSNCLNFAEVGPEKVLADVQAKSRACGGKPKRWKIWKKGKYRDCMESLS